MKRAVIVPCGFDWGDCHGASGALSDRCGIDCIIACVSSDETDVDDSIWVVDLHDQAVLIPCDVEHNSVIRKHARRPKVSFDGRRAYPVGSRHFLMPGFQRAFCFGMSCPESAKGPFGNDSHGATLSRSQYGNNGCVWGKVRATMVVADLNDSSMLQAIACDVRLCRRNGEVFLGGMNFCRRGRYGLRADGGERGFCVSQCF